VPTSTITFNSVWGTGPSNLYAVGTSGVILRFDGTSWTQQPSDTSVELRSIAGTSPSDLVAVGDLGTVLRSNGVSWSAVTSPVTAKLHSTWVGPSGDQFSVGEVGTILFTQGRQWQVMPVPNSSLLGVTLTSVFGTSLDDVWVTGHKMPTPGTSAIVRFNGTRWSSFTPSGTSAPTVPLYLRSVWASGPNDVWLFGTNPASGVDTGLRFDGTTWQGVRVRGTAVRGTGPDHILAVHGSNVATFNGTTWQSKLLYSGLSGGIHTVWPFEREEVFLAGAQPLTLSNKQGQLVRRFDGVQWRSLTPAPMNSPPSTGGLPLPVIGESASLTASWGSSPSDLYFVGSYGSIVHWDGTTFKQMNSGVTVKLNGIFGLSPREIYAVGEGGTILRYDGVAWAIERTGGEALYSVWGQDQTVYVTGSNGLILRKIGGPLQLSGGQCPTPLPATCGMAVDSSTVGRPKVATTSYTRGAVTCASGLAGQPAYYRFDAPMTGTLTVRMRPYETDLDLVLLDSSSTTRFCQPSACAGSDVQGGLRPEKVSISVERGKSYYFAIDAKAAGVEGSYGLDVSCVKQAVCGNGSCEPSEDCASCASDCNCRCGDGRCTAGESALSCSVESSAAMAPATRVSSATPARRTAAPAAAATAPATRGR
jgi:hypothetical protein